MAPVTIRTCLRVAADPAQVRLEGEQWGVNGILGVGVLKVANAA